MSPATKSLLPADRRVRLAVYGLAAMMLALVVVFNLGRISLLSGHTYQAEFADASGLKVGEEVRVAGIKVGEVTDIELGRGKVIVSFRAQDVDLGSNTAAGIEVKTLLGQHFMSLTPEGAGAMEPGETIPLERTATPLNVVPAFQRLTDINQELDTDQVAKAFDSIAALLEDTAPHARATLDGLSRLSRSVASRDQQIQQLFTRADSVSGVIAARDQDLARLLTDSDAVLQTLDSREAVIRRMIRGTGELARQLTALIRANREQLGPALDKLTSVVQVLNERRAYLDEALELAEVYGREFANVGGTGRWFDASLKFPRQYAVCSAEPKTALSAVLDPVFSAANQAQNGESTPCLPLGPASSSYMGGR